MKMMLTICISLILSGTSYGGDPGEGAVGQRAWIGKGPEYFLVNLPSPPRDGCPGIPDAIDQFSKTFLEVEKELGKEIGKRHRALKKWNEQNSRKMMEDAVNMPGFKGKNQDEMKKMSKAQRKQMAEQMMQDKYGVSMDDLQAQKKANKEGKSMANVDFAKTMAGEMQANDLMKSKGEREADKRKIADTGKLAKEQAELSQNLYRSIEGRAISQLEELDKDRGAKKMREERYDQEDALAAMIGEPYKRPKDVDFSAIIDAIKNVGSSDGGNPTWTEESIPQALREVLPETIPHETGDGSSCQAKEAQCSRIHTSKKNYCSYMAPKLLKIITEMYGALTTSQSRFMELDRINSDLQKAQTGIGLPDAALGLSGLEALQRYVALLGSAYAYNPGVDRCKDLFCGGEQPGTESNPQ